MPRQMYVYIVSSLSKVIYIGVTNDLHRRIWQHKDGTIGGFTRRYRITRLVYFEAVEGPRAAIGREKQLKGWLRSKKIALIEAANPHWFDLAVDWFAGEEDPSLRSG